MQKDLKLNIEGMHCDACVRRVSAALAGVPGVAVGTVEIGSAEVAYQPDKATPEQIAATVEKIGFTPRLAE